jgi:NADH dehydrogenase/NADH:ubiquinone oxidoreductase subunit G
MRPLRDIPHFLYIAQCAVTAACRLCATLRENFSTKHKTAVHLTKHNAHNVEQLYG